MSRKRVLWSEGLFLQPQHFQQLERAFEALVDARMLGAISHPWGFTHLRLDESALQGGCIAIASARGLLPDGTPFAIPDEHDAPPPLEIAADAPPGEVHLALPRARAGVPEFSLDAAPVSPGLRFVGQIESVADAGAGRSEPIEMIVGQPNLRLLAHDAPRVGLCSLALARVVERRAGGAVALDPAHLPPALACRAVPRLQGLLGEAAQRVRQRAEALAARLHPALAAGAGAGEFGTLSMLQIVNRLDAALAHLLGLDLLHPEQFYATLAPAVAELATFSEGRQRRPPVLPAYAHGQLQQCFDPLMAALRDLLDEALHPHAVALALTQRAPGLYTARLDGAMRTDQSALILTARADLPAEELRRRLPAQVKIAAPERLRDLVRLHLPALPIEPLAAPPPRMPFLAGHLYFEVVLADALWPAIADAAVLALHLGGEFPGLQLGLWVLRDGAPPASLPPGTEPPAPAEWAG